MWKECRSERMNQGVLRGFGHLEKMGGERLVKMYDSVVIGMCRRGRDGEEGLFLTNSSGGYIKIIGETLQCRGVWLRF